MKIPDEGGVSDGAQQITMPGKGLVPTKLFKNGDSLSDFYLTSLQTFH